MPKKRAAPLKRHHVFLYEGDWDELAALFGPRHVKPGTAVREIVHTFLRRMREIKNEIAKPVEIDIDELDLTAAGSPDGQSGGPVLEGPEDAGGEGHREDRHDPADAKG
jgi:hypothetical protein